MLVTFGLVYKCRILHAPNQIAELSACKMRLLKQFNSADLNKMRVQSNIRLFQFHCRSWPVFAEQQREMTKFCVLWTT